MSGQEAVPRRPPDTTSFENPRPSGGRGVGRSGGRGLLLAAAGVVPQP